MNIITWDSTKIHELNTWIDYDCASSVGAVLLELKRIKKILEDGGILKVIMPNNQVVQIEDVEKFYLFISEHLKHSDYFIKELKLNRPW
jgi:hypothetical protein